MLQSICLLGVRVVVEVVDLSLTDQLASLGVLLLLHGAHFGVFTPHTVQKLERFRVAFALLLNFFVRLR